MPQLIRVIAPGFGAQLPRSRSSLGRITFPYVLLICAAALVSGVLNGLERFGVAAAAYVLFNVVGIAAILCLTPHVPQRGARRRLGHHRVRRGAARRADGGGGAGRDAARHCRGRGSRRACGC